MQKLTSLVNSLYQEFFSGKGSVLLDPIFPPYERGESWELTPEKGRLQLRAGSFLSLAQALSFIALIPPDEIESYFKPLHPRYAERVLKLPAETELSDELLGRVVSWGFNTLAVEGKVEDIICGYSLKRLHPLKIDLKQPYSRKLLAKEYLLERLKEASSGTLLSVDSPSSFEELHFEADPTHRLAFTPSVEAWRKLRQSEFSSSNFLPTLTLPSQRLSYFPLRGLSTFFEEMRGGSFKGAVVELEEVPPPGSYGEVNVRVAGFSLMGAAEVGRLFELEIARLQPELWNREALALLEEIGCRVGKRENKHEKAKALADLALLETHPSFQGPFQKIASSLKVQFNGLLQ